MQLVDPRGDTYVDELLLEERADHHLLLLDDDDTEVLEERGQDLLDVSALMHRSTESLLDSTTEEVPILPRDVAVLVFVNQRYNRVRREGKKEIATA